MRSNNTSVSTQRTVTRGRTQRKTSNNNSKPQAVSHESSSKLTVLTLSGVPVHKVALILVTAVLFLLIGLTVLCGHASYL
eukprot:m.449435 g.449435  ORF g.449435 m.449435 type:complete len:80 (+) comp19819_c0_seq1:789-1028(+)